MSPGTPGSDAELTVSHPMVFSVRLGDHLLRWRPYVRRSVEAARTACELVATMPYRAARHGWQRLTGGRCSLMNFWRMVQGGGERLVREERDTAGEIRK